jgi:hypothetical protein
MDPAETPVVTDARVGLDRFWSVVAGHTGRGCDGDAVTPAVLADVQVGEFLTDSLCGRTLMIIGRSGRPRPGRVWVSRVSAWDVVASVAVLTEASVGLPAAAWSSPNGNRHQTTSAVVDAVAPPTAGSSPSITPPQRPIPLQRIPFAVAAVGGPAAEYGLRW